MKTNSAALVMILALATPALTVFAQDNEPGERAEPRERREVPREHFGRRDSNDRNEPREGRRDEGRPPGRLDRIERDRREQLEGPERDGPRGPRRMLAPRAPDAPGVPDAPRPPRPARGAMPPVFAALDVDHDGVIDKKEIARSAKALKKLDENGDGKLTAEEIGPRPPLGRHHVFAARDERPRRVQVERFHHDDDGPQGPPRGAGGQPRRPLPPPEDER